MAKAVRSFRAWSDGTTRQIETIQLDSNSEATPLKVALGCENVDKWTFKTKLIEALNSALNVAIVPQVPNKAVRLAKVLADKTPTETTESKINSEIMKLLRANNFKVKIADLSSKLVESGFQEADIKLALEKQTA
jgi:hypothetical protein